MICDKTYLGSQGLDRGRNEKPKRGAIVSARSGTEQSSCLDYNVLEITRKVEVVKERRLIVAKGYVLLSFGSIQGAGARTPAAEDPKEQLILMRDTRF